MAVKVIFVGNIICGDDGIGPFLYNELKNNDSLKSLELLELGVVGLDLLNYVSGDDKMIIVDGLYSKSEIGKVTVLEENDLQDSLHLISLHDYGVEKTASILRFCNPDLKKIHVIGINVKNVKAFSPGLSDELKSLLPEIKNAVMQNILKLSK